MYNKQVSDGKTKGKTADHAGSKLPLAVHWCQFCGALPESLNQNGAYDMICIIIDQLTAMVHLVLMRQTYKLTDMAEVLFDSVYTLHGLPEKIISDWDSLFMSHFWRKLYSLLNVDLQLSLAFHP